MKNSITPPLCDCISIPSPRSPLLRSHFEEVEEERLAGHRSHRRRHCRRHRGLTATAARGGVVVRPHCYFDTSMSPLLIHAFASPLLCCHFKEVEEERLAGR